MKVYTVTIVVQRENDSIKDIEGVFSSFHNAYQHITNELEDDVIDMEKVSMSKNKHIVNVPAEALDTFTYPHTYYIDAFTLDEGIDPDDDDNDDD